MEVPEILPEGVDPTSIRKCAGHPLGINGTRPGHNSLEGKDERIIRTDSCLMLTILSFLGLVRRACVTSGPTVGCEVESGVGYCWKVCGTGGEWCWTASNGGFGGWDTCISASNCGTDNNEYGCGAGGCDNCGCSCSHPTE
jgi:hypothetical protein